MVAFGFGLGLLHRSFRYLCLGCGLVWWVCCWVFFGLSLYMGLLGVFVLVVSWLVCDSVVL